MGPAIKLVGWIKRAGPKPRRKLTASSTTEIVGRMALKCCQLTGKQHMRMPVATIPAGTRAAGRQRMAAIASHAPAGLGMPRKKPAGVLSLERP